MTSKPFRLEQLLKGFCPPSTVEDSDDDESNNRELHASGLVSGVTNDKQANPPTGTTPTVDSMSDETMDDWDKVSKSSRRRILPASITTKSPASKKDTPCLAETPSSAIETEGTPAPSAEKELSETEIARSPAVETVVTEGAPISRAKKEVPETESAPTLPVETDRTLELSSEKELSDPAIVDSLKAIDENISNEPTNDDFASSSEAIDGESVPITAIDDKQEEVARSSANSMFIQYMVMVCAFVLYFFVNFNRADIESMSFDSILALRDKEAINTNSRLNSMIPEDTIEAVPDKASDSVKDPPPEEVKIQDEIGEEDRESEYDDAKSRAEPLPIQLEYDEASSSQEHGVHMDAIVEQVVEGSDMNSDLECQEEVGTNVEQDARTEDWESDPEMQMATSAESDSESNSDRAHEKVVDANENDVIHGFVDVEPEHRDQEDTSTDEEPDEQSEASFDHDAIIRDVDSDLGQDDLTDNMPEHDSYSNLDHREQIDTNGESDSETEIRSSNPEHEEQVENSIEPEAEIDRDGSGLEHGEQPETSAENDDGIDNAESDLVHEEQEVENSIEPEGATENAVHEEQEVENSIEPEGATENAVHEEQEVENSIEPEGATENTVHEEQEVEHSIDPEGATANAVHEEQVENSIEPEGATENAVHEEQVEHSIDPEGATENTVHEEQVEHSIEPEGATENTVHEEQVEHSIDPEGATENAVHEEQVEDSIESEGATENTVHEEQVEHSIDPEGATENAVHEEQVEDSIESEGATENTVHEEQVEHSIDPEGATENAVHEEQEVENSIEPEGAAENADADLEDGEQPEMRVESGVEIDDIESYLEHEEAENFAEAEVEIEKIDSDVEQGEPDISAENDFEIDNVEHEEYVDRIVEQDVEIQNVDSDLKHWEETENKNVRAGQEDSDVQDADLDSGEGSIAMEDHEINSAETPLPETLEFGESNGTEEDSEFERQEDSSIPNEENLTRSSDSSVMAGRQDFGTDATDENENNAMEEEFSELDSMEDMQHSAESEAIVAASDDAKNHDGDVDVVVEPGLTLHQSELGGRGKVEVQSPVPENSTMRFFKLRSDELGPYLVICEAYLTIDSSPEFVCSE